MLFEYDSGLAACCFWYLSSLVCILPYSLWCSKYLRTCQSRTTWDNRGKGLLWHEECLLSLCFFFIENLWGTSWPVKPCLVLHLRRRMMSSPPVLKPIGSTLGSTSMRWRSTVLIGVGIVGSRCWMSFRMVKGCELWWAQWLAHPTTSV